MTRTVLFVPGFREDIASRDYRALLHRIESRGYKTKFVSIKWSHTTLDNWVNQLQAECAKYQPNEVVLAGFSFGAVTALAAASTCSPSELWLFSVSPYIDDDPRISSSDTTTLKRLGTRRIEAFRSFDFASTKDITFKTLIFLGSEEAQKWPDMRRRSNLLVKKLERAKLISVEGVGHDVTNEAYQTAIKTNIT